VRPAADPVKAAGVGETTGAEPFDGGDGIPADGTGTTVAGTAGADVAGVTVTVE